jgi:hypothetical protein
MDIAAIVSYFFKLIVSGIESVSITR